MVKTGDVFHNRWEVTKCIGKGSFSEIFEAKDLQYTDNYVAIKVQKPNFDSTVIKWESEVLKSFKDCTNIPNYILYDQQDSCDYLVMQLLTGEDMSAIRNRIRNDNSGLIPAHIAAYFTLQIFTCVRKMHEFGYLHRDIKPSNFVRKHNKTTEFCIIDFGIAKQYKTIDGHIKPARESADFRGTTQYVSPFVHDKSDQCPRDDLFSVLYVFIDLICGNLPWTEDTREKRIVEIGVDAKEKRRAEVGNKKKYYLENPLSLIEWMRNTIINKKDELDQIIFPEYIRNSIITIANHLKNLTYLDVPDYAMIENILKKCLNNEDVGNINYRCDGFDWNKPSTTITNNNLTLSHRQRNYSIASVTTAERQQNSSNFDEDAINNLLQSVNNEQIVSNNTTQKSLFKKMEKLSKNKNNNDIELNISIPLSPSGIVKKSIKSK
eukprot:gene6023-8295_t